MTSKFISPNEDILVNLDKIDYVRRLNIEEIPDDEEVGVRVQYERGNFVEVYGVTIAGFESLVNGAAF